MTLKEHVINAVAAAAAIGFAKLVAATAKGIVGASARLTDFPRRFKHNPKQQIVARRGVSAR